MLNPQSWPLVNHCAPSALPYTLSDCWKKKTLTYIMYLHVNASPLIPLFFRLNCISAFRGIFINKIIFRK